MPIDILKTVVLPAPLGPSSPTISPGSTWKVDVVHHLAATVDLGQIASLEEAHRAAFYADGLESISAPSVDNSWRTARATVRVVRIADPTFDEMKSLRRIWRSALATRTGGESPRPRRVKLSH